MKPITFFTSLLPIALCSTPLLAESDYDKARKKVRTDKVESAESIIEKHATGTAQASDDQDELSADVQDLIQEQTDEKVITLLEEAEKLMAEATDRLVERDTSGGTIAIETEIIEKIHDAAKQKQQSSPQQSQNMDAMMKMMQQMMGQQPSDKPGENPGAKAGEGMEGDSSTANDNVRGGAEGDTEERRLPKKAGNAGRSMPREFHKALDAYNKAAAKKSSQR